MSSYVDSTFARQGSKHFGEKDGRCGAQLGGHCSERRVGEKDGTALMVSHLLRGPRNDLATSFGQYTIRRY